MRAKVFALLLSGVAGGWLPATEFDKPVMLKAGRKPLRVESPEYACPGWADLNGYGKPGLLVGQLAQGRIKVLPHQGGMDFSQGAWLKADKINTDVLYRQSGTSLVMARVFMGARARVLPGGDHVSPAQPEESPSLVIHQFSQMLFMGLGRAGAWVTTRPRRVRTFRSKI